MTFSEFDVAIVGASLAGSSAAIRLGQAGCRVALIDKSSFPRSKPCGEGLSAYGVSQLEHLGIRDSVLKLPHLRYAGYKLKSGSARATVDSPLRGSITMQREILDAHVLSCALKYPTVTPMLSQRVVAITPNAVEFSSCTIFAKHIVLASGSNSPLLKQLPCQTRRTGPSRSGVSAAFKGSYSSSPTHITIILKKDYEIYCTPLANDRLNLSVLKRADANCDLRAVLLSEATQNEVFGECCFSGTIESLPEGRTNIGNIRRRCSRPSVQLAGDAKEEFDPIGGMGMSHALRSGIEAADAIINQQNCSVEMLSRRQKEDPEAHAMRIFTALSYHTLVGAKRFPFLLSLAASRVGSGVLKFATKELV